MKLKLFLNFYKNELGKLMETHFAREAITRDMAQFRKAVEPIVREDEYTDFGEFLKNFEISNVTSLPERRGKNRVVRKPLLREFIAKRHESVAAQLIGERQGYIPGLRQRPGNRGVRKTRP